MSEHKNNDDRDFSYHDFRDHGLDEEDLRAHFAELRREEEAQAPQFALPSPDFAAQRSPWFAGRLVAAAVCLLVMAAAVFWLQPSHKPERIGDSVASVAQWKSPTDFLLQTPGRELLQTVPTIGAWHDYTQVPTPKQKRGQPRKQVLP
jgi:hypothetical protein